MKKQNVLFVDDDQNVTEAIQRNLRRINCNILRAGSAKEAMIVMEQEDCHVVVSDERMPVISGTEFLVWVKNNYPKSLRIMLSGEVGLGGAVRAINEAALYLFIPKPVPPLLLSLIVSRGLEHYSLREAAACLLQDYQKNKRIMDTLSTNENEALVRAREYLLSGQGVEQGGSDKIVNYEELSDSNALVAHIADLFPRLQES
jgi:DNA-binding NtrC family response regulator